MQSAISLSLFLTLGDVTGGAAAAFENEPAARGEPPAAQPAEAEATAPAETREARYAGLTLAPAARNPLPLPKDEPPKLVWTGFTPGAGGSEIFLQTTRPVVHDVVAVPGQGGHSTMSVFLRNCRIHARNNARRIDTSFFPTPVGGVAAKQRRKDVEVSISLKESVVPTVREMPGPNGTQIVVLTFPPAAPASVPEAPVQAAAALAPTSLVPAPVANPSALAPPPMSTR